MTNGVAPLSLLAGTEHLGKGDEGWTLIGPSQEGIDREFNIRIDFSLEFSGPPVVPVSLVGFDISNSDFARLKVVARYIDRAGFTLCVSTCFNTEVHGVDVSWLALGT